MGNKESTTASGAVGGQKIEHTSSSSKGTHTASAASASSSAGQTHDASTKRRIIQNFLLIWLDANIDEPNDDFRHSMAQLRRSVNTIDTFTDPDRCVDYLTGVKDEKALMIVSGALGQHTMPLIHDLSQLNAIFVFCGNKPRHEQWAKQWPKVKGVFTEIGLICDALKQAARQCDQDTISISFVSTGEASGENLDQLDQSYMYTQILKEILFEMDYDQQSIKDLTTYCRLQYAENDSELTNIANFEREYGRDKSPIWWYTYECFLYSMLNRALRSQEVDTIIKMGFFIRDLHRHITELHEEQYGGQQVRPPFTVYRGQGLSIEDFGKLMKTKGGLMSFNNFLSTSKERDVSFAFADSNRDNSDYIGILFRINIDPSSSTATFAGANGVSYYQSEEEILFSMHTVFRIGDVKKLDNSNRLWQVELRLTDDNDPLLSALTERMREETEEVGPSGWPRLGMLLIKLGHFNQAEQMYNVLLDQKKNDDDEKAHLYHMLGCVKDGQGDYVEAISFYKKSLQIKLKTLPPDHPDLASSYGNIGLVYFNMGEYSKALSFFEKALEIRQKTLPPNHPSLAEFYNNIGSVYDNMGEYSKALSSHEKALEIRQKILPPNHPSLAESYNNTGLVYHKMGEYPKALSFYEKALEINRKALPPTHPHLASDYNNIGGVYSNMGEYSKALLSHEKAHEIYQKTLPPNHPDLATSYSNIGGVYDSMGEYSKALSFYEKDLEISQKTLPPNHPDLATSYKNIGSVHEKMAEYSKARSALTKCLNIQQISLDSNNPTFASTYSCLGRIHRSMKDYAKALAYFEQTLEIRRKTLPEKHPYLAIIYSNIGDVRRLLTGDYSTALSFLRKALEIQESVSCDRTSLAWTYTYMGETYREMKDYSTALEFHGKALEIRENVLPSIHPDLAVTHHNLAKVYRETNQFKLAHEHAQRAVEMAQQKLPESHPHLLEYRETVVEVRKKL